MKTRRCVLSLPLASAAVGTAELMEADAAADGSRDWGLAAVQELPPLMTVPDLASPLACSDLASSVSHPILAPP